MRCVQLCRPRCTQSTTRLAMTSNQEPFNKEALAYEMSAVLVGSIGIGLASCDNLAHYA
ncbi:uncharacterized protein EKO05_0005798 [Ascochyta rabiei]|uniref:uncharacterized protein n=1 Tax=Didymella rabiei TaxID=5454 RepID=UPI00220B0692|nr:uncharacterized protein EKO05_0005798 [Ascochyta rabiei]UPX15350.1 hypothetical protein EKO05_0005798 [Ascochyta rabiei]